MTYLDAEDEWVLVPGNPDLRVQVDWDKKELLGAEYRGVYHKIDTFTDEIRTGIDDFLLATPLPFHHFKIPWRVK